MIVADFGSEVVKWFDGKNFGTSKVPKTPTVSVISTAETFLKVMEFPRMSLDRLKKIATTELSLELYKEEASISVAVVPLKKKGEKLLCGVFVERAENVKRFKHSRMVLPDVSAVMCGALKVFGKDFPPIVDAGSSKLAVISTDFVEVFKHDEFELFAEKIKELGTEFVLVGGKALDRNFLEKIKGFKFKIPKFEPFGEKTPLFFPVFGGFHVKRCGYKGCYIEKKLFDLGKREFKLLAGSLCVSMVLFDVSFLVEGFNCLKTEKRFKEEIKREVSSVIEGKIVAPLQQLELERKKLAEKKKIFGKPERSFLETIELVSKSVVDGVEIVDVSGSIKDFSVSGYAKDEKSLEEFFKNLRIYFKNVEKSSVKEVSEGLRFKLRIGTSSKL